MSKTPSHKTTKPKVAAALAKCRSAFISVGFFSMFINLLMLTGPLFMLQVYDRVLASKSLPTLTALVILIATLFLFLGLLEMVRTRILARIADKINTDLRSTTLSATIKHAVLQTPNVGTQPVRDLDTLKNFVGSQGPSTLFDLPWTPIYLAVNFMLHWVLGIFSVLATLFLLIISIINEILTKPRTEEAMTKATGTALMAEETKQNAEILQAMGMEKNILSRWEKVQAEATKSQLSLSNISSVFSSLSKSVRMFLQSCTLAVGAILVIEQLISPGAMIAASIILTRALAPIDQSIAQWRNFANARKAYQRLKSYLGDEDLTEPQMPLPEPKGKITVEKLFIAPPGVKTPILRSIDFTLTPGEALGVLGPTGAGKSCLARALIGTWEPLSGAVRLDGATLDQWNPDQLGPAMGYLPQSVELLSGTVKENIARFTPEPAPEQIVKAAILANVHELVLSLPDGYDTVLGEGGYKLSGGQKQRIGLARALYNDPCYIILDEPNSNLDAEGEAALTKAIASAKNNGQTVVVVAHRPSALQACDKVLFLREGKQLAFGPRDEILSKILANPQSQQAQKTLVTEGQS